MHVVSWLSGPHKQDEQADRKLQPVVVRYNNDPVYSRIWILWFDLLHLQIQISVQVMLGYAFHNLSIASIN